MKTTIQSNVKIKHLLNQVKELQLHVNLGDSIDDEDIWHIASVLDEDQGSLQFFDKLTQALKIQDKL